MAEGKTVSHVGLKQFFDDRESNIQEWEEMGGTGILHVSAEEMVRELKQRRLL